MASSFYFILASFHFGVLDSFEPECGEERSPLNMREISLACAMQRGRKNRLQRPCAPAPDNCGCGTSLLYAAGLCVRWKGIFYAPFFWAPPLCIVTMERHVMRDHECRRKEREPLAYNTSTCNPCIANGYSYIPSTGFSYGDSIGTHVYQSRTGGVFDACIQRFKISSTGKKQAYTARWFSAAAARVDPNQVHETGWIGCYTLSPHPLISSSCSLFTTNIIVYYYFTPRIIICAFPLHIMPESRGYITTSCKPGYDCHSR